MTKTIVMIHGMFGGGWYWDNYKAVSTYKEFQNHAHWIVNEPGWEEVMVEWLLLCAGLGLPLLLSFFFSLSRICSEK